MMQHSRKLKQSGLSLMESLVALIVLALGILGLAGVQTRLLVETRTSNSRAVAVQLIDDLRNRMAFNLYAAVGKSPLGSSYALTNWNSISGITAPNPVTCLGVVCTATQLAAVDMFVWRMAVNTALPGSQVQVFQNPVTAGDPRQIGIAIAWPLNERAGMGLTAETNAALTSTGVTCPANFNCHIVYVQP